MTETEMDGLIRGAMDSGILHGLIPRETAELMRARLTRLMGGEEQENMHEWDGCLMCAVRALTEGRPKNWGLMPRGEEMEPGTSVTGVVLRQGNQPSHYEGQVPFVDLWLGGIERVRVAGHGTVLREAILAAEIQVGDTVTVTFEGQGTVQLKAGERTYRKFSVEVKRGHH